MRVILERYEPAVLIASSGMGTLWEGTDRLIRKIVIKLICLGRRRDSGAMRRLNREAHITARLCHPGAPVLYDFGTDEGELFMVMNTVLPSRPDLGSGTLIRGARSRLLMTENLVPVRLASPR